MTAATRPTWRLGFTVEVFADNEAEATEKARELYDVFNRAKGPIADVRWVLPVATVKERDEPAF